MEKKSKSNKVLFVVIFLLIALSGGILGASIFKFYVDDYYFTPFVSEVNLSGYRYNSSNLVIRDPKKVVVSQDLKTIETATQAREYMLGIFLKEDIIDYNSVDESESDVLSSFYNLNNPSAVALVLTSDGWLMTIDESLNSLLGEDLIAIDSEKNIYQIDEVRNLEEENLFLIHLSQANNLEPINFASFTNLKEGGSLVIVDYVDRQLTTTLLEKEDSSKLVKNSDEIFSNLYLSYKDLNSFSNPVLFNLEGQAVAFWNDGAWTPLDKYSFFWKNSLGVDREEAFYPSLGVNYIDLAKISFVDENKMFGALVYPDSDGLSFSTESVAEEAGLKAGDIIKAVNDRQIDKETSLKDILSNYSAGEEVDLTVYRNNSLEIIPVVLNNNKKYDYKISE